MPSFINFNNKTCKFEVLTTRNTDAGTYTLVYRTVYTDYNDTWQECELDLKVLPLINDDL